MATSIVNLTIDEVSIVDRAANPGARVILMKSARDDDPATTLDDLDRRIEALSKTNIAPVTAHQTKGTDMVSLTDTITKALTDDSDDNDKERMRKATIRKALELGATTVEKVAAELAIESLARTISKRDGGSFEQAYVKALDDPANRNLVQLLA